MSDDIEARNLANDIKALIGGPLAAEDDASRLIAVVLREARRAARNAALEEAAKVADFHYTRSGADGLPDHGSQCAKGRCNDAIAAAIRKLRT